MDKKRKIIIGACAAVCAVGIGAGAVFFSKAGGNSKEKTVYVMSVSSMNEMAGVQRLAGVVESQKTQEIQKDAEREIKEIFVKTGDEVDVGTKLFSYDTETLETDIQQAKLDLERIDNEMGNIRTQIEQLQKEKKAASAEEQLSYTTQIQTAEMDLKKAEYERKGKEVEITRIQSKIDNSTVTSEMKGVVKSVNSQDSGNEVIYSGESQAFMTILATGEYRVKGKVNEQNTGEIIEGEKAVIRSRINENDTWKGTFSAIDTKNPDKNTNNMMYGTGSGDAGETTSTSYNFYVELDSSEGLLLGQHVYIEKDMGIADRADGIWLDEAYIQDKNKKPYVWAETENGTLEKRPVVLGDYDENMMQYKIEKGLEISDYVAYPQDFFEEGIGTTHNMEDQVLPQDETIPEGEMIQEESGAEI